MFGDVVLISVPYAALPQVGRDLKAELAGKIVLETGNPYPQRDGEMAVEARRKGTGVASLEFLPGVRLVRAFNAINSGTCATRRTAAASRTPSRWPATTPRRWPLPSAWCSDAGFAPVVVGPLSRAREFDVGTAVYTRLTDGAGAAARPGPAAPVRAKPPAAAARSVRGRRSSKHAQLGALAVQIVTAGRASSGSSSAADAHEHQVRARLGGTEKVCAAGGAEAAVRHVAAVGHQAVVAQLAAHA